MAKQKIWRCAVLGSGSAGESNIQALQQTPLAELVAVVSAHPEKARGLFQKLGVPHVPVVSKIEQLAAENVEVLVVTSPSAFHAEAASAAFGCKINVICEKPLDIRLEKIDAMIAAAAHNGVRLAGIFQNRWNPAVLAVKSALEQGRFGTITWAAALVLWHRAAKYYQGWRGTPEVDGGAAIMNQSIHTIDLLQWLAGPVRKVSALSTRRLHTQLRAEDTLSATLEFASGALGTIVGSTAIYPQRPARIEIAGTDGIAVVEGGLKEFSFREPNAWDQELVRNCNEPPDLLKQNIEHVLANWADGKDSMLEGAECRKAVAIVLALYASATRGGEPVSL